ncbi:MAG: T9SS type A sorting domain-containing protein [Bacteroidales bacterium]|nr:T9SS type A sorting domain-containing protein [Bacteroidales bacterium]
MKKFLLFILVVFVFHLTNAQQHFTNYASKNTITSLADKGSQMWIGTSGGLYVRSKSTGAILLTYTVDNGLPSSYVNDVVVDPFDNVWVATRKGLAKFNGSTWTIYNTSNGLPNNLIDGITVDQSGNIWVYSFWNSLSKLESNGTWTTYGIGEGFPNSTPFCITTGPNGNIWIGTNGSGAYEFDVNAHTFTQYAGHFGTYDRVYDIIVDANSEMWFASYGGLANYDFSTWSLYTTADGLAAANSKNLTADASGNIWVGHYALGVTKFDPNGVNTEIYQESDGLVYNYTQAITVDSDGKVWIGTQYGLSRYDVAGNTWNNYIVSNSLSNNEVQALDQDASGNLWIGTEYGLNKFNGTTWTNWFEDDGLIQDRVKCLDVDNNGDVWTGANYGLSFLDVSTNLITTYGSAYGITQANDVLCNNDGSVWVATTNGLIHFDGVTTTTYTTADGLVSNSCYGLLKDGSGNIWVGTSSGISVWNGSTFSNYTTADGLSQNYVSSFSLANNGDVWAFCQAQISVWNGTAWSQIGFYTSYDMDQDVNGNYWIANYYGAKKYDGTNTAVYTSADGMADDVVYEVEVTTSGIKWFGTYAGLIKATCEAPSPSFTSNVACLPGATNFTNTSDLVDVTTLYEWDINNDGSVEYTSFEPSHAFVAEGIYSVKLTAYNDDCTDVFIQDVEAYNTPEIMTDPMGSVYLCSGSSMDISAINSSINTFLNEPFDYFDLASSGWAMGGECTDNWFIASSNVAGGSASPELKMNYNTSYNGLGWVESPTIDVSAYGNLSLSFTHSVDDYSGGYVLGLKTSSDGTNWNTVWSILVSGNITPTTETINISNADIGSSTFQIAFFMEGNSYNLNYWYIDDLSLSSISTSSMNPAYTFDWSQGSHTSNINVSASDTYTVTVYNNVCSYEPAPVTVNVVEPLDITICMVTVDTTLVVDRNLIVWEKPVTTTIDYFNIYKEVSTDVYSIIGSQPYSSISEFVDYTSTPDVHADKYKISVVDTCGNESDLSPYHQTMNLSQAQGAQSDELVLLWNKYIDESGSFVPANYFVYRGVDQNNMNLESTLSGGLSSYNYNAQSVINDEHFIVVIDMPTCAPTTQAKASGGPYYQSMSNLEDEGIINVGINQLSNFDLKIYPNPITDKVTIESEIALTSVRIIDLSGRIIRQYEDINQQSIEILRDDIVSGSYFIEINQAVRTKVVFN